MITSMIGNHNKTTLKAFWVKNLCVFAAYDYFVVSVMVVSLPVFLSSLVSDSVVTIPTFSG